MHLKRAVRSSAQHCFCTIKVRSFMPRLIYRLKTAYPRTVHLRERLLYPLFIDLTGPFLVITGSGRFTPTQAPHL